MKATQILMEEHRVIERVIGTLEAGADRLERGDDISPAFFIDTSQFIKGFADGCHHVKEEKVLFPAMNDAGLPRESGPIGVMLAEHEQGRKYARALREAAEQWQSGDSTARPRVIANARGYAALLRQHIAKEEGILFPLADQVIPLQTQDQVAEGFEHVEHEETGEGVHEKYLALATKLAQQVAN